MTNYFSQPDCQLNERNGLISSDEIEEIYKQPTCSVKHTLPHTKTLYYRILFSPEKNLR